MSKSAHLIPVKDDTPGEPIPIPPDGLVVGRDSDCDYVIDGDGVSRFHASFLYEGKTLIVEDMNSTNGVSVNGRLLDKRGPVKHGDLIQICAFDFVVGNPENKSVGKPGLRVAALAVILVALIVGVLAGVRLMTRNRSGKNLPTGKLTVRSSPTGASIYDHGEKVGQTPYVFKNLKDGEYRLLLRLPGHKDKEVVMTVPQGETRKIHALEPVLAGTDELLIRTLPAGAKVFVDDELVGTTEAADGDVFVSRPLKVPNVNLEVGHRVFVKYQGNVSKTYVTKRWNPSLEVVMWAPDHVLVKKNGDSILGMIRSKDDEGNVEMAISRTESTTVPAYEIAELRTVLPPVFKNDKGVEKRRDADGVLELIVDPFPDDDD